MENLVLLTLFLMLIVFDRSIYLERLVTRKKIEVETLLRRHQTADDPLVMRMGYMASKGNYNVTASLKRPGSGKENLHTMSVAVDLKRTSPTIPTRRNVVEFNSAADFATLLAAAGVDAFFINTDELEYGGKLSDLKECSKALKEGLSPDKPPPACIAKDIIIHPVQIAQALEHGASGVLLIVAVVGADLEVLLDACTIMGCEAVVEVHTPKELEFALSRGATIFLVNLWDRMTGILHRDQAKGLANMLPVNSIAMVAGDIKTVEQAGELGLYGYESVVLGRNLAELPDIKDFIDGVHSFRGAPRGFGLGMKGFLMG